MSLLPACSILVPVYNGAQTIEELVSQLAQVLPGICAEYEAILVNDGSRDGSWQVIQSLAERYPWVRGVNMLRNYGQHNALLCGLRLARCETVITMDDDLQNPPAEIQRLLEVLAEGYDVVYGTPQKEQHGLWRDLASQVTKLALQSSMGVETARNVSAFRAIRTRVRAPGSSISTARSFRSTSCSPGVRTASLPSPSSITRAGQALQLYFPQAGAPCSQHGNRIQRPAFSSSPA